MDSAEPGSRHISPRLEEPRCGFTILAQANDPLARGLRIYRRDDGKMICNRCIVAALGFADDEAAMRRARARRLGWP